MKLVNQWRAMLVVFVIFGAITQARADIQLGLSWLQNQVTQLGQTETDVSLRVSNPHAWCEMATTLLQFSGPTPQSYAWVNAIPISTDSATQVLGCKARLQHQIGLPVDVDLGARKVQSGGYVAHPGQLFPNAIDTSAAVGPVLQRGSIQDQQALWAWLQSNQRADGSFSVAEADYLLSTAWVLRGLRDAAPTHVQAARIAEKAAAFLLASRHQEKLWASDISLTALVYEAVHPYSSGHPTLASEVNAYLNQRQQANGSWENDPFTTAVVLRALKLTGTPPVDPSGTGAQPRLQGKVTDAGTKSPLAAVDVSIQINGSTHSVQTDSQGGYGLALPMAGQAMLLARKSGYQSVSAVVNLDGRNSLLFSPSLRPVGDNSMPPQSSLEGRIVRFGTSDGLAGVQISVQPAAGGTEQLATSEVAGRYSIVLKPGVHRVQYNLNGYQSQVRNVIVPSNSVVQMDEIALQATDSTATLSGSVTNTNGEPIEGATLLFQPQGWIAKTSSFGQYIISGIPVSSGSIIVTVSAQGYIAKEQVITLNEAQSRRDFVLSPASNGGGGSALEGLQIQNFDLNSGPYRDKADVTAQVLVKNAGLKSATAGIRLEVFNTDGELVDTVAPLQAAASPLNVSGGQAVSVPFKWNTGTFRVGSYRVIAKLFVLGSMSQSNPMGIGLGSASRDLHILASPRWSGSLQATPPVVLANAPLPVQFSALIRNDGNTPLPEQAYTLTLARKGSDTALWTRVINAPSILVGQTATLNWENAWTPNAAGDYSVLLTSAIAGNSSAYTSVYVGEAASAQFSVNPPTTPPGTPTVRGTIKVRGQDVAMGTVSDPLAPLVKDAITKAVNHADTYAVGHYVNDLRCFACHVQTQTLVGGERNRAFHKPINPTGRTTLLNALIQAITSEGHINEVGVPITNTSLSLWALSHWHSPKQVTSAAKAMVHGLANLQDADGKWPADHPYSWWRTSDPLSALNISSLLHFRKQFQSEKSHEELEFKLVTATNQASGVLLAATEDGSLFIGDKAGQVISNYSVNRGVQVLTSGVGFSKLTTIPGGRLIISSEAGVGLIGPDGILRNISSIPAHDAQPLSDSELLVLERGNYRLHRINLSGQAQLLGQINEPMDGYLDGRMTVLPDATFLLPVFRDQKVLKFSLDGRLIETVIPITPGHPLSQTAHSNGMLLATTEGVFHYDSDWVVHPIWRGAVDDVAFANDQAWIHAGGNLLRSVKVSVPLTQTLSTIDNTLGKAIPWLIRSSQQPGDNNIDLAFRMMALGSALQHPDATDQGPMLKTLLNSLGAVLRSRQKADGGWVWQENAGFTVSDSMVTAMVGLGLDHLNPSPASPEVRNAVQLLLGRQQPNGSWTSENAVVGQNVPLIPSTWVEIWLPTMMSRLGGIDTGVVLRSLPSNPLSNFSPSPASVDAEADGSTTYRWALTGVTNDGQSIAFDARINDLQPAEVRPLVLQAQLVSNNQFVPAASVVQPLPVPHVTAESAVALVIATDKAQYQTGEAAQVTAALTHGGVSPQRAIQVRWQIRDALGQTVSVLNPPAAVDLVPGQLQTLQTLWSTTGVLAGNYRVLAELITPQGVVYASAEAPFAIQPSGSNGTSALNSTRVVTDRSQYNAAQTVHIQARMANLSVNQLQQDLTLVTTVLSPNGQNVFSRSERIAQAPPQSQRQYTYSVAAGALSPGLHTVKLQLLASNSAVLSSSTSSFAVGDTQQTGIGLRGSLLATPSEVDLGGTAQLQVTLANHGNAALSDATLKVRVLHPDTGVPLSTYTQANIQLAMGATTTKTWNWVAANANPGAVLPIAATIILPGNPAELPLAQTTLRLTTNPVARPLTGTLSASPATVPAGAAVGLVYTVANPNLKSQSPSLQLTIEEERGTGPVATTVPVTQWNFTPTLAANGGTYVGNQNWTPTGAPGSVYRITWSAALGNSPPLVLATARVTVSQATSSLTLQAARQSWPRMLMLLSCTQADDAAPTSPTCDEPKAQAVRDYLKAQGHSAKVVTSRAEFETDMRCGSFNIYALSGGGNKLSDALIQEVRASLAAGVGLWLDGAQTAKDRPLHEAARLRWDGALTTQDPIASLGGMFAPGGLKTLGKPARYTALTGATPHASFGGQPNAIAGAESGSGRALVFAFNVATLMRQPTPQRDPQLDDLVRRALNHLAPPSEPSPVPGAANTLSVELHNTGTAVANVHLTATVPAALHLIDSQPPGQTTPAPNPSGNATWQWTGTLPPGQRTPIALKVLNLAEGEHRITWQASSGTNAPAITHEHHLRIQSAATLAQSAVQALSSWQPSSSSAVSARNTARTAATAAQTLMTQARPAESLPHWASASQALAPFGSDTVALQNRNAISQALQAAQNSLCLQWACISGQLDFTVQGQTTRSVPLQGNVVGSRSVRNHCPAPIKDIPITASWVNRRTGQEVQNLWDNLTLNPSDTNRRDNGWQANGQSNDIIDVTLTANWPTANDRLFLDRDALQLIVLPPILSGTLQATPQTAKLGQNVTITRSISNSGALVQNLPVTIRITDPAAGGALVQEIAQTLTLNPGERNNGNTNWVVKGPPGKTLRIELRATVNGTVQTLATTAFTISP